MLGVRSRVGRALVWVVGCACVSCVSVLTLYREVVLCGLTVVVGTVWNEDWHKCVMWAKVLR